MPIKITQQRLAEGKEYIYSDLHLDIQELSIQKNGTEAAYGTDIKADYNMLAIKNSIRNIFNTRPGQRLLYPTFGVFLDGYLFEAISDSTARRIGDTILQGITKFENRVQVQNINVTPDADQNTYYVTITLYIPILDISTKTDAVLLKDGFYLV